MTLASTLAPTRGCKESDTLRLLGQESSFRNGDYFAWRTPVEKLPRKNFSYQSTWHCIIGRHFGSYVTHEKSCYCYFYIGQMGVMVWKTP